MKPHYVGHNDFTNHNTFGIGLYANLLIDMDTVTPEKRSQIMSRVRCKDTKPEMIVRRLVYGMGYRYRLHGKMPGKPDLVFKSRKKVIFVHGCFWHNHKGCKLARMPKSRVKFWSEKLEANRERDLRNHEKLRALGWNIHVVWECQLGDTVKVSSILKKFLDKENA